MANKDEWREARSIVTLRDQLNALAPRRSKASDGTIGDAAHRASKSEHNPEDHDNDPETPGVVRAIDITHDPAGGMDGNDLLRWLITSKDPRILYIIFNRKMYRSYAKPGIKPWDPAPYGGSNPHTKHLHLSVVGDSNLFDSTKPWAVGGSGAVARRPVPTISQPYEAGELVDMLEWLIDVIKEPRT